MTFEEGRILTPDELDEIEQRKAESLARAMLHPDTTIYHARLTLDFFVRVAGTPPDDDGMNVPDPIYHDRQARLLEAVKTNPAVLRRWLVGLITAQMDSKGYYDYWNQLNGGVASFQEMLIPAIATLPQEDQESFAYVEDLSDHTYFEDMIDLFMASFQISEDPPKISDILNAPLKREK